MNDTPRVTVPVEPTAEMLEAGILAAWPGPEIVYADEHAGPEFMLAAAFKAMLSVRGEVDRPVWFEGAPTKHHAKEWFIAETTFGDRVVLTALPEEYTYDFKTADETYIKADRIKRWMPFPDSEYLPPSPAPAPEGGAVDHISSSGGMVLSAPFSLHDEKGLISHSLKAVRVLRTMLAARDLSAGVQVSDDLIVDLEAALATREEAPAEAGEVETALKIATDLHHAYEQLIYGLPKYLEAENLTDEENMIREAWITLDVTAHRIAALAALQAEQKGGAA